jgi:hypothetical protein
MKIFSFKPKLALALKWAHGNISINAKEKTFLPIPQNVETLPTEM